MGWNSVPGCWSSGVIERAMDRSNWARGALAKWTGSSRLCTLHVMKDLAVLLVGVAMPVCATAQVQLAYQFPPVRNYATVAYEPNTGEGYLFGGEYHNDLYRHDDGRWVSVATATPGPTMFAPVAATWPGHGMLVVGGSQTWLFDGVGWNQLPIPSPQLVVAMAYDPIRTRMVAWVSGGTREFDGTAWWNGPGGPLGTAGGMAWHANLQRIVLLVPNSIWRDYYLYDGVSWTLAETTSGVCNGAALSPTVSGSVVSSGGYAFPVNLGGIQYWPASSAPGGSLAVPPRRTGFSWYDPIRQRTVLTHGAQTSIDHRGTYYLDATGAHVAGAGLQPAWGSATATYDTWHGTYVIGGGSYLGDTKSPGVWTLRDDVWADRGGPQLPQAASSTFDSRRGRVVITGGGVYDYGGGSWSAGVGVGEWDGVQWTSAVPPVTPSPRLGPLFVYDPLRARCVLYGGAVPNSSSPLTDTWEWDGTAWQSFAPVTVPGPGGALVFDRERGQCVLAAGTSLFAWNGVDWHVLTIPWSGGQLGYDVARDRLVRSVGYPLPLQEEWNGSSWVSIGGGESAPAGTFDLSKGAFVGYDGRGLLRFGDPAAATIQPFGAGCLGTAGVPVLHGEAPPRLGRTLELRLEHLPAAAPWFGVLGADASVWLGQPLPIDLSPAGMPGCAVLAPIEVDELRSGPDWSIAVPTQPALLGARFAVQAYVLDAAANALGLTVSNGVRLRCGA